MHTLTPPVETNLTNEFNRQLEALLQRGYPRLAGLSENEFAERIRQLRDHLDLIEPAPVDFANGRLPFVIVITPELVPTEETVRLLTWSGNAAFVDLRPRSIADFHPTDEAKLPSGAAYLLADIDRGTATLNVPPADAIAEIKREGRSPLTIEEGIAILTQYPEFLVKNHCFSLLGSRCGDRRVPALWISERRPRLGWCWEGAPHTWLGSASCRARLGVEG